ncbi:hypothetical protein L1987_57256 [Smallanthus sonchifolius]|uniref:Uncharacterized protein n=1 Tax=Smallanthus sonchifolius TaxID=185202 RepID=A0ACB9DCA9_9ASTR|nr:hypothetical protein L1987_57256 [Smallanthus sonchifolius]
MVTNEKGRKQLIEEVGKEVLPEELGGNAKVLMPVQDSLVRARPQEPITPIKQEAKTDQEKEENGRSSTIECGDHINERRRC